MLTDQQALVEVAEEKRLLKIGKALDYLLIGHLQRSGASLLGFSVKIREDQTLLTLRLNVDGERLVSFIGGETPSQTIVKAAGLAAAGSLRYRADKYAKEQD